MLPFHSSKFIRFCRFLTHRLREEKGVFRLYRDVTIILQTEGLRKLFSEIGTITNQEQRALGSSKAYLTWISKYDYHSQRDRNDALHKCSQLIEKPVISIITPDFGNDPEAMEKIIRCLEKQLYPHWELCLSSSSSKNLEITKKLEKYAQRETRIKMVHLAETVSGNEASVLNEAASLATGEFLMPIFPHDLIPENALYEIACFCSRIKDEGFIYMDEDKIDRQAIRFSPLFKPDWNEELFRSQDYIKNTVFIGKSCFEKLGGFRRAFSNCPLYDLLLRASILATEDKIIHIPRILYHRADRELTNGTEAKKSRIKAIQEYLTRQGIKAKVEPGLLDTQRVRYTIPESPPMVSLIIPTRDRVELLSQAVDAVLNKTDYQPVEIIIVDNGSAEQATHDYFKRIEKEKTVRILPFPGTFNYSAMINHAVDQATGDYLCLFNNDIDAIHADWLNEMMAHAMQKKAGAVGAKLLYADKRIQHAGVVLGMKGVAGHVFKFMRHDQPGYQARLQSAQQWLAVTAACLVVAKKKFMEVGGFDTENLKVAFNDVDFCMKLHTAGYRNIYTPYAELFHLESASRGVDMTPKQQARATSERDYLAQKWQAFIENDPFHSPNLSKRSDDFSIRE